MNNIDIDTIVIYHSIALVKYCIAVDVIRWFTIKRIERLLDVLSSYFAYSTTIHCIILSIAYRKSIRILTIRRIAIAYSYKASSYFNFFISDVYAYFYRESL